MPKTELIESIGAVVLGFHILFKVEIAQVVDFRSVLTEMVYNTNAALNAASLSFLLVTV